MKETIIICQILYVIIINYKLVFVDQCIYLLIIVLEQEPVNVASAEIPTDNGVTKEFDPLRNSKEERSKTPQTSHQVKCKYYYQMGCFILNR